MDIKDLSAGLVEMVVFNTETREVVRDIDRLMKLAGLDPRMRFEAVALQEDGVAIVCDKCGNFSYLPEQYSVGVIMSPKAK